MNIEAAFTLVELMVVIAIMSILTVISIPAGYYWVGNSRIANVTGNLTEAVGRAKNAALRNEHGVLGPDPVAIICISDIKELSILEGTATAVPVCEDNIGLQKWAAKLDAKVTISSSGSNVTCICFNNMGLLTTTLCADCLAQPTINLATNDLDETIFIY